MSVPLHQIMETLQEIAPLSYAEDWDNVGLLVGRTNTEVTRAILTIDLTDQVMAEAAEMDANLILSYHPVIFHAIKRITDETPKGRLLLQTLSHDMAIYSPHTALDSAPGGMTDWFADSAGKGYRRPLKLHKAFAKGQGFKVVTFIQPEYVDRMRDALASSGAGQIGNYDLCSFNVMGFGTFRGTAESNPKVGDQEQLERVDEVRLEMVCSKKFLPVLVATLKQFHPYDEPAFDLYPLEPTPNMAVGSGRRVVLDQPATIHEIGERVKKHLGIPDVRATDHDREVRTIGFIPGAGADFIPHAIEQECDLFVTGEVKHHEVMRAKARGCSIMLTGHSNSERGFMPHYRDILSEKCPEVEFVVSQYDQTLLGII